MKRDVQRQRAARSVRSATQGDPTSTTRSVNLSIAGQRLSCRTDKDEDYLRSVAAYVDETIEEIRRGTRAPGTNQVILLAALTIADEFFQARERTADLKDEVQQRTERLMRMIEASGEKS